MRRRGLGYIEGMPPFSDYQRPEDSTAQGEARVRYRDDYRRRYKTAIWPRVGGTIPEEGLNDSDLPTLKYIDVGYVLDGLREAMQYPANKVSLEQVVQDVPEAQRAKLDGGRLGRWMYVRLGGRLPTLSFERYAIDHYLRLYANTPKGILARWLDVESPPRWTTWPYDQDDSQTIALAILWARAVLSQRLGYAVPTGDAVGVGRTLSETALAPFIQAALDSVQLRCDLEKGAVSLGLALFSFLAPQASVPLSIAGAAAGYGVEYAVGEAIDEACANRKKNVMTLITVWRSKATPRQMQQFIRSVYAVGFNVAPESVSDEVVSTLDAQTATINDARDIAAFILQPSNDPNILAARNLGRRDRLERISETFYGVVGCDANVGFLNVLADRWEQSGWTEEAPLKKLLKAPSPLTRYVASGSVCAPQVQPGNRMALAHPSATYYRSITGKTAPWTVEQRRYGEGRTAPSEAPSATAAVVLGTAAGAAIGGPVGAVLGLAAGLLFASKE
jgi:hypothetical protein